MTVETVGHHTRYVTNLLHDWGPDQHYRDDMPTEEPGVARLAQLIRDARETLGWTQEDLAREADVSRPTVQRYENGKSRIPEPDQIRRIFLALRLDPRELPVLLGLVTREEIDQPAPQPMRRFSSATERIIALLEDPAVSDAERHALAELLEARGHALRAAGERSDRKAG
ncbi:multiprotein-bridging factor 1 family protein [Micromonospora sp. NPDC020750]|uniref:helix-turn-helix domain-containing protein n=1 Tax=unclassified Micromonospora TaxID=2617518 RepID=UPI0037AC7037